MSVKHYGIYTCYQPWADLRAEGLGRYMAFFVKAAMSRDDVRFVVACPSWSKTNISALFETEGIPAGAVDIVSPDEMPYFLKIKTFIAEKKASWRSASRRKSKRLLLGKAFGGLHFTISKLADARNVGDLLFVLLILALCVPGAALYGLGCGLVSAGRWTAKKLQSPIILRMTSAQKKIISRLRNLFIEALLKQEQKRLKEIIENMGHVTAWYCPAAFWPAFNEISTPRLMCVPDFVNGEFPSVFAEIGGPGGGRRYKSMLQALRTAEHIVTYSETVKWGTLVDKHSIKASNISVVRHAPSTVLQFISVDNKSDVDEEISIDYCRATVLSTMMLSKPHFSNRSVKYIFYASQPRPNKNITTLLRSYEFLLKKKGLRHKLILSAPPIPEHVDFVRKTGIENDVFFTGRLTPGQLAACYKLADIAVNPSLSEGGCPFTFTEALSVDTPVVMSRISVTEEVLSEPEVQEATFFDPYDWRDMADRIEWALDNRERLLELQRPVYARLAQRTWNDVVNEHIEILDRISRSKRLLSC